MRAFEFIKNELIVWNRADDSDFPKEQAQRLSSFFGYELSIRKITTKTRSENAYLGEISREEDDHVERKRLVALKFPLMMDAKDYLENRVKEMV